jgi:hypothetical protein
MQHTLEKHRFFPYIAWATVISFALFTYTLAMDLQDDLDDLNQEMGYIEYSTQNLKSERTAPGGDLTE